MNLEQKGTLLNDYFTMGVVDIIENNDTISFHFRVCLHIYEIHMLPNYTKGKSVYGKREDPIVP